MNNIPNNNNETVERDEINNNDETIIKEANVDKSSER